MVCSFSVLCRKGTQNRMQSTEFFGRAILKLQLEKVVCWVLSRRKRYKLGYCYGNPEVSLKGKRCQATKQTTNQSTNKKQQQKLKGVNCFEEKQNTKTSQTPWTEC